MDNMMQPTNQSTRLGFHYYPDTLHFRDSDLAAWMPEVQAMAGSWLTLQAPINRAIPESFLRQLLQHNIQPVLHFHFSPAAPPTNEDFNMLCRLYARWGVRYVVLFDRPNIRSNWPAATWAQSKLVERFLDIFQPLALTAIQAGIIPVFPPLEPGGDYWDTAFLRAAFEGLLRRNQTQLLDSLAISGYAWTNGHPISWGAGGPERWPASRPYDTPNESEDQRGFRIFDWYLALSEAVFGERKPMLLLGAGCLPDEIASFDSISSDLHVSQNLSIARLAMSEKLDFDPIPSEVLACNFWLLTASKDHPAVSAAWYKSDGTQLPAVGTLKQWAATHGWTPQYNGQPVTNPTPQPKAMRPILHYLLLPKYEWGVFDWHLDAIRPFIKKYHPTIGFSPAEAVHAKRVTILGDREKVPDSILEGLTTAGCIVEDLRGDGTTIASRLAHIS
jgi:hypothetical protein